MIRLAENSGALFGAEMAAEVWDSLTVHYAPPHGSW
jgi:hypothetical protein